MLVTRLLIVISFLCLVTLLALSYLHPTLLPNEVVYLVKSKIIHEPDLLKEDWTFRSSDSPHSFFFSLTLSPLWIFLDSYIHVAQASRVLLWTLVIYSIVKICNTLSYNRAAVFMGLFLFVIYGQGFAAGEWILRGAEQKVVAYAFVFLSLNSLLKNQTILAGVYSGIAFCFHILVGGWSGMAVGITLILLYRREVFDPLLKYAVGAIPFVLPMTLWIISEDTATQIHEVNISRHELLVLFRNPHHLDPFHFMGMGPAIFFILISCLLCAGVLTDKTSSRQKFIFVYLLVVSAFFLGGLLFRTFEYYKPLIAYPFRVADVMLPLFFCITASHYSIQYLYRLLSKRNFSGIVAIAIVLVATTVALSNYTKVFGSRFSKAMDGYQAWHDSGKRGKTDFQEMTNWIKANTEKDTIFAVNPCRLNFWILSDRAMIVNFKSAPSDSRFYEWYKRLSDLNGGKAPSKFGWQACHEITMNFGEMRETQLMYLVDQYGMDYYLTYIERKEFESKLAANFGTYYLYSFIKGWSKHF